MELINALTVMPPNLGAFPRSFNALENLEFFLRKGKESEAFLRGVGGIEDDKNAKDYFRFSNEAHNYLKACYLFSEVFFGAFVSDLSEREVTFHSFLANPKIKSNIMLPSIVKLTQAFAISVFRGKIIGHIKTPGAYNAITNRKTGYRIIYNVLNSDGDVKMGFPSDHFQFIDEFFVKFCPHSEEKNYWNRLDLLFNSIPFGQYGKKAEERTKVDDIVGQIGTRSKTISEIENVVLEFIQSFYFENEHYSNSTEAYKSFPNNRRRMVK